MVIFAYLLGAVIVLFAVYYAYSRGEHAARELAADEIAHARDQEATHKYLAAEWSKAHTEKCQEIHALQDTLKKTVSQKKSSEVRTGLIAEQSLAFLQELPYDFNCMRFIGAPVDYFYFDISNPDSPSLTFIEVKSGGAKESKTQRLIRKAVLCGNVSYELVRIDTSGISIKRYEKCVE